MALDKNIRRRQEILKATLGEIATRGIGTVRIADIAKARGISTGLVHYHFETKDQLIAEAFSFEADQDLEKLNKILDSALPIKDKLIRSLELYGPQGDALGWRIWIDGWSEALRNEELRHSLDRLNRAWTRAIESLIAEGAAQGLFTTTDATETAHRLIALVDGLAVRAVLWPETAKNDEKSTWLTRTLDTELQR